MRRLLSCALAGLALGLAHAGAAELKNTQPNRAPTPKPAVQPEKASCGDYGTSVHFVASPSEAARQALKEKKLVFVLHVSGLFEDPKLT